MQEDNKTQEYPKRWCAKPKINIKDKVEILNAQFKPVFTLDNENNPPSKERPIYPNINKITR